MYSFLDPYKRRNVLPALRPSLTVTFARPATLSYRTSISRFQAGYFLARSTMCEVICRRALNCSGNCGINPAEWSRVAGGRGVVWRIFFSDNGDDVDRVHRSGCSVILKSAGLTCRFALPSWRHKTSNTAKYLLPSHRSRPGSQALTCCCCLSCFRQILFGQPHGNMATYPKYCRYYPRNPSNETRTKPSTQGVDSHRHNRVPGITAVL